MSHRNRKQLKIQAKTRKELLKRIKSAGLEELHALEGKVERLFNAGCLSDDALAELDGLIMEGIARFECLT